MDHKFLKPRQLELDPNASDAEKHWKHWKKTFDNFLVSFTDQPNDVQKLAALTNHLSHTVYPYMSSCTTYTTAMAALTEIYVKPKNEIYSRHCLLSRQQQEGESVDEYMHVLDVLSKECTFEDVAAAVYRNEYVRDSFIRGLKSSDIRQRLLEECTDRNTTFTKARTLELSVKNSQLIGNNSIINAISIENDTDNVTAAMENKLSMGYSNKNMCIFCGNRTHPRSQCPARNVFCHSCGNKGHFAKFCLSRPKQNSGGANYNRQNDNRTNSRYYNTAKTQSTAAASYNTDHEDVHKSYIAALVPTSLSDTIVSAKVSGHDVKVLIDSGSSQSYINSAIAQKLGLNVCSADRKTVQMASESHVISTLGAVFVDLELVGHAYYDAKLQVMQSLCTDVIIGHDIINQREKLVVKFGGHLSPMCIDNISESGFACTLGTVQIEPPPLFHNLSRDVKPVACKSRRYTLSEIEFINKETSELLKNGVIEPSNSPWRAQVLVTTNDRHKRRMVVDYSHTINKHTELDAYPLPNLDLLANKIAEYTVYSTFDLKSAYHQVPICEVDRPYTAFESGGRLYQFTRIPFGVTNGVAAFQRVMDSVIDKEGASGTFAYLDNITVCGKDQFDHDANVKTFMDIVDKYNFTLNHDKSIKSVTSIKILGYLISKAEIRPDPDRMKPLLDMPVPQNMPSLKRALGLFSYYSRWVSKFSDRIKLLTGEPVFPLNVEAADAFNRIKQCIVDSCLICPNNGDLLVLETDASDHSLSATLNQGGRPVAFFSRTLNVHERHHPTVEKEACAIVEAARKWRHYLCGRRFLLLTDQQAVSFMFDNKHNGKVKNDKILRWRIELSCLDFDIKYRPGNKNVSADCLSRAYCSATSPTSNKTLHELHSAMCHPGVTRMSHYVRTHNLPYSMEDVKRIISQCTTCAHLKPKFFKPQNPPLIKSTQPLERISIDFKGPLPSGSQNKYILTIVDEFSRFPFAFPCKDLYASTVKRCLTELFALFGTPGYVHSDRGRSFIAESLRSFLIAHGIGSSFSAPYNPRGNGQCERYNGIIWKTVQLALDTKNLHKSQWEVVLPEALHSIRSLLCTATNMTPHERFFGFARRTTAGHVLPTWLLEQGKVLLRRHVRVSKYDPVCDEVDLVECNPSYAQVRLPNGTSKTVSLRDLAPLPTTSNTPPISEPTVSKSRAPVEIPPSSPITESPSSASDGDHPPPPSPVAELRRSGRKIVELVRTNYSKLGG